MKTPLNTDEQELLYTWEEFHRKGQLTLWMLLALSDQPRHMAEIKLFIEQATKGTISADDKSIYRALRRYQLAEMVDFKLVPGEGGPERKSYFLTTAGRRVLYAFIDRNISNIYFDPNVDKLLKGVLNNE